MKKSINIALFSLGKSLIKAITKVALCKNVYFIIIVSISPKYIIQKFFLYLSFNFLRRSCNMPTINQLVRQPRSPKETQQVACPAKMPSTSWRVLASEDERHRKNRTLLCVKWPGYAFYRSRSHRLYWR